MNECGFILIILYGLEPIYKMVASFTNFAINNHLKTGFIENI